MTLLSLKQLARAVVLCWHADKPVAVWSDVGAGKSSLFSQIAKSLKRKLYDIRLSDKLCSDFGAPVPDSEKKWLNFIVTSLLPFDSDESCIVLIDEFGRESDMSVQNMCLQLIHDRSLNGRRLSKNARMALAGNGATDVGTIPLSRAARTRMVHLYVDEHGDDSLESYLSWAQDAGISPMLRAFAHYRRDAWNAGYSKTAMAELALPTRRTFDMADELLRASEEVKFETSDIIRAVVEGCVGTAGATELLAWRKTWLGAPTIDEVLSNPKSARLPDGLDVTYAFTLTMLDWVKGHAKDANALFEYAMRFENEQSFFFFKSVEKRTPEVCVAKNYLRWKNEQGQ